MNAFEILAVVVVVFVFAVFLRRRRTERHREERRCTCPRNADGSGGPCGGYTHRVYKMVSDDEHPASRFGGWFIWYIIDAGVTCGHVTHVAGGPDFTKFFNSWKLLWRRFLDPKQFVPDEELLVKAGIISVAVRSISHRARLAAEAAKERRGRLRARLDQPLTGTSNTETHTSTTPLQILTSARKPAPPHRKLPKP